VWSPAIANPPADLVGLAVDPAITLGLTVSGLPASARYEDTTSVLEFPDKRVSALFPGDPRTVFIGPNLSFTVLPRRRDFGDYNDDGVVNAADYVVWRGAAAIFGPAADGDADGDVDQSDYSIWRAHFGQTIPGSGAVTSAPEPSTALLLIAGFALLIHFRRASTA
jgi:hypothetical protein